MFRITYIIFLIVAVFFFGACSHEHSHEVEEEHEHGATSVTQYTDSTEIFMEYPALVVNREAEFLIHLTDFKKFQSGNSRSFYC